MSEKNTALKTKARISLTRNLPNPNMDVRMMEEEFSNWAFNEERAPQFRGKWRSNVFKVDEAHPLDLEIGTGNGYFFAHRANARPERALLGIELKYKPLIQSIRRAIKDGATNVRIMRYDAWAIEELFAQGELNDVFIHFPDPWEKKKQWKHRLIDDEFIGLLHSLQRPGSVIDFKTDSLDYFEWAMERFRRSQYEIVAETRDLHASEWAAKNFVTHFESLWTSKGIKINYALLRRP
ncbi:MAG: tRNA (guanosine(46)-N7)-methyltransferase TrmB [Bdellovibrionaceae bacterium]|nr:tRNA (guanosine(46)-N7)-methyltransferase TrmB [Pseudobdellovibrionaceae bacterium]